MSKKIALISPFFYPEPISTGKYNTLLAQGLADAGCELDVYCSHPIYPDWKVTKSDKQLKNITIIRGGANNWYSSNKFVRRIILEFWFSFFVLLSLAKNRNVYDSIVFIMPPSLALYGIRLLLLKVPVICIVHDLQVVLMGTRSSLMSKYASKIISRAEKASLKAATDIIYLSHEMKRTATNSYQLLDTPAHVFYPFITINQFINNGNLDSIIREDEVNIVYSGALGEKQSPHKLINFLNTYAGLRSDLNVLIFSRGPYFDELKNNYKEISFHDLVPEEDLPELLMKSTIQIIPQEEGASTGSLPSKLPNILAAGCKVFCITDEHSELGNFILRSELGEVAHTWDQEVLIKTMNTLVDRIGTKKETSDLSSFRLENILSHIMDL